MNALIYRTPLLLTSCRILAKFSIVCLWFIPSANAAPLATGTAGFRATVAPFLAKHCNECHGAEEPEGKLSLSAISGMLHTGEDSEKWKRIADRLALGEMPPEKEPRPDAVESAAVVDWIKSGLTTAGIDTSSIGQKLSQPGYGNRVDHEALFSGKIQGPVASPARLWRMRPQSYLQFVPRIGAGGTLEGKTATVSQPFSSSSGSGFKDYAELFVLDEPTLNQLMRNAKQIVAMQCGESGSKSKVKEFTLLLDESREPTRSEIESAIAKQFQLALLRKPTVDEIQQFVRLMQETIAISGRPIGVKYALATILLLPEAMYRFEMGRGEADAYGRVKLAPRELAYAISMALTDDAPDAELRRSAESGKLTTKADIDREVRRILGDRQIAKPQIMRFFDEYFGYVAAEDVFKDLGRKRWRPDILIQDTRQLIQSILDEDHDVLRQLLTTNKAFVNARYDVKEEKYVQAKPAKQPKDKLDKKSGKTIPAPPRDIVEQAEVHDWYALPVDWQWTAKQPLELPAQQRSGILTQPSWLAAYASNNENHPIQRGRWVRERLLGGVVPDIPISVDAQLPDAPDQTLRQRMQVTHENYCWQCHQKMNPLGVMFEHYDFVGAYREAEPVLDIAATEKNVDSKGKHKGDVKRRIPIDSSGSVDHTGDARIDSKYEDAVSMLHVLADSPRVRQVFVRHAFRFWMGRNETLNDSPTLIAADNAYVKSGGSMQALIASLLTSDSFLYRWSVPTMNSSLGK